MGRSRDQRADFEGLVRRHAADLYRLAYRLQGEAATAEDLVQETYYQAWRSFPSLRDPEAGRAWLTTILRRRWARGLRERSRRPALEGDEEAVADAPSPLPGPDLEVFARREGIQSALGALDGRLREAFLLVFLEGLSCREAAERLDVPRGTVLSRVHRARVALRTLLGSAADPGARSKGANPPPAAAGEEVG